MEFYRCATAVLPKDYFISPDVGSTLGVKDGLADFYVNSNLQWIVEVLQEGSDIDKHYKRFTEGPYKQISSKDWILVDFCAEGKNIQIHGYEKMLHVCYNPEFTKATVKKYVTLPQSAQAQLQTVAEVKFEGGKLESFLL